MLLIISNIHTWKENRATFTARGGNLLLPIALKQIVIDLRENWSKPLNYLWIPSEPGCRSWATRDLTNCAGDKDASLLAWQKCLANNLLFKDLWCLALAPADGQANSALNAVFPLPGPPTTRTPQVFEAGLCSKQWDNLVNAHSRQKNRFFSITGAAIFPNDFRFFLI